MNQVCKGSCATNRNRDGGNNMDVEGAWRQGFTGRGVAVTILDDGIEKDHPGKGIL